MKILKVLMNIMDWIILALIAAAWTVERFDLEPPRPNLSVALMGCYWSMARILMIRLGID